MPGNREINGDESKREKQKHLRFYRKIAVRFVS